MSSPVVSRIPKILLTVSLPLVIVGLTSPVWMIAVGENPGLVNHFAVHFVVGAAILLVLTMGAWLALRPPPVQISLAALSEADSEEPARTGRPRSRAMEILLIFLFVIPIGAVVYALVDQMTHFIPLLK